MEGESEGRVGVRERIDELGVSYAVWTLDNGVIYISFCLVLFAVPCLFLFFAALNYCLSSVPDSFDAMKRQVPAGCIPSSPTASRYFVCILMAPNLERL